VSYVKVNVLYSIWSLYLLFLFNLVPILFKIDQFYSSYSLWVGDANDRNLGWAKDYYRVDGNNSNPNTECSPTNH